MNNNRFATYLHILTLLRINKEVLLTSEYIAGSINTNPAIVRKAIKELRTAGIVFCKEGKGGGCSLAKAAVNIVLSDIYIIVKDKNILGRENTPNPKCPVGRQINQHLDKLYSEIEHKLVNQLKQITLENFTQQFQ